MTDGQDAVVEEAAATVETDPTNVGASDDLAVLNARLGYPIGEEESKPKAKSKAKAKAKS